jgi:carboxylesterase type B
MLSRCSPQQTRETFQFSFGFVSNIIPLSLTQSYRCLLDGGGYGLFSSTGLDATDFMATNGNNFISVVIQYRLGAFGFLSGEDVKQDGALNAGLLDMNFALQWVQKYIRSFGGDPTRVTLAGESAGAAAVMYQSMAYGGKQVQNLFNNVRLRHMVSIIY